MSDKHLPIIIWTYLPLPQNKLLTF